LNDDHTPMEFVVEVLVRIFDHDRESAARTMLWVHSHDIGARGTYPSDIAAAKAHRRWNSPAPTSTRSAALPRRSVGSARAVAD